VFPGEGAPLVWFDNFTHHPAYDGIVEALKNGTKCKTRAKRERQVRPKMLSDKLY
jgi:endo-1,4-beta-xylanase